MVLAQDEVPEAYDEELPAPRRWNQPKRGLGGGNHSQDAAFHVFSLILMGFSLVFHGNQWVFRRFCQLWCCSHDFRYTLHVVI